MDRVAVVMVDDQAFHAEGRPLHEHVRRRVHEQHQPPAAPRYLELRRRAPPEGQNLPALDSHRPIVADGCEQQGGRTVTFAELRADIPRVGARAGDVARHQAQAPGAKLRRDERAAVRPPAAERQIQLQAKPPRFARGVSQELVPLRGVVADVADGVRRVVHRDGIDGLYLGAAQAGVAHEGQLARNLRRRHRATKPPPAGHRLGRVRGRVEDPSQRVEGRLRGRRRTGEFGRGGGWSVAPRPRAPSPGTPDATIAIAPCVTCSRNSRRVRSCRISTPAVSAPGATAPGASAASACSPPVPTRPSAPAA